jgi:hypothetical protein
MLIEPLNQTQHETGVVILPCMRENVKKARYTDAMARNAMPRKSSSDLMIIRCFLIVIGVDWPNALSSSSRFTPSATQAAVGIQVAQSC